MGCLSVNHTICLPEVPKVASRVTVPLITQEVEKPDWEADPLWPAIDFVPDNEFWAIVSDSVSVDASIPTFVCFKIDRPVVVDWGDGTGEEVPGNTLTEHVYMNGTGTPDSSGNTVWLMKVALSLPDITGEVWLNAGVPGSLAYRVAGYKYICLGQWSNRAMKWNISYNNNPTGQTTLSKLEAIRFFGKNIWSFPALQYCYNLVKFFCEADALVYGISDYAVRDSALREIGVYFGKDASVPSNAFYGANVTGTVDLSNAVFSGNVFSGFYMAKYVQRVILPTRMEGVASLANCFLQCFALSRIDFPASLGNVSNIQNMLSNTRSLEYMVLPEDLGANADVVQAQGFLSRCAYSGSIYLPAAKLNCISAEYSCITGFVCSPESPLDTPSGGVHANVSYTNMDRAALTELFRRLPETDTAKTVAVTGAKGAADLTDEDKLIATAKGWIIRN